MSVKREILVVEDNAINREILCSILSDDYTVLEAENGQEALDILNVHKNSVSLILLDVMMPVMDGYTFLDRLKEDASMAMIPVIVITQSNSEADELAALAHGATDFVPKPYRPRIIQHRVAALIQLRETAALVNYLQYDRLTGLYCKEYFYKRVQEQLQGDPEGEYCILCTNIENFKLINEIFGARNGETIIKAVADRLKDMIGGRGFCARLGTDRFLALYKGEKGQSSEEQLSDLTGRAFSSLPESVVIRSGMYEIDDRSISSERMCDRAALAADKIKYQYDQHFAVYDDTIRSTMLREQAITSAMETALNEKQFQLYLQPKFSLNESCISGAEALVRWTHPTLGVISPGEFVPLFERTGFVVNLDRYIWEQACIQLCKWKSRGCMEIPISVNVSRVDIFHIDVPKIIRGLVRKYDLDPAMLHIEITESAYGEYPEEMRSAVDELRQYGFIVEMDDFGSGYSSLSMLSQISLDVLKLDMKFTQNELAKPVEMSFLGDVIRMAHRLRLDVVAEGVETHEQRVRLQEMGCDYVQGYYFSRPLPIPEFEKHMENWKKRDRSVRMEEESRGLLPNSILIADEDAAYRESIGKTFREEYRILEANSADDALACLRSEEGHGICAVLLSATLPGGADGVLNMLHRNPEFWNVPVMAVIPEGTCMKKDLLAADDFMCRMHPIFDLHRRVLRMLEATYFREKVCVLQDAVRRDPLTGLLNRRGLMDALNAVQNVDMPLAVCMFDIDNLKPVNDVRGHQAGDEMLKAFADALRRLTRLDDIKCRYGGDEFVVVLKRIGNAGNAMKKGQTICRMFRDLTADADFPYGCSVGIAISGPDGADSSKLIERADQALRRAKQENKGGVCLWEEKRRPTCTE